MKNTGDKNLLYNCGDKSQAKSGISDAQDGVEGTEKLGLKRKRMDRESIVYEDKAGESRKSKTKS